jgi:hypothetical protein
MPQRAVPIQAPESDSIPRSPSLMPRPAPIPPPAINPESPSNNNLSVSNKAIPASTTASPTPAHRDSSWESWATFWSTMSSISNADLQPLAPHTPPDDDEEMSDDEYTADDTYGGYATYMSFETDYARCVMNAQTEEPISVQFDISLFLKLPLEIRNRIYACVLANDKPIRPHLCDPWWRNEKTPAKFHDDNAAGRHGSVHKLMSLTRASRQFREESFPVFYSANLFAMGDDTSTYLAYLEEVGRLEWVHHVELVISSMSCRNAAATLRGVHQFDAEVEGYQRQPGTVSAGRGETTVYTDDLRNHPRYQVSGLSYINLAILLRMLSTTAPSASLFPRRIVLPVSNSSVFETESRLQGLAKLAQGLDVELRFVERPGSATREGSYICIRWDRKYQKKEDAAMVAVESGKSVMDRTLEMYPDLEEMARPKGSSFYRTSCSGKVTWYDVKTMGGGRP